MKNILSNKTWMLCIAMCLLTACNSSSKKQNNSPSNKEAMTDSISGVERRTIDSITVTWIQDNIGEKMMPRELFADAPDSLIQQLSLQNGIPSTISTFLVESNGVRILFDTGLGTPNGQLLQGLEKLHIAPEDIQYIYLTHFHGDHIGGLIRGDTAVFPNATLYASKVEHDAWLAMPAAQHAQVSKMIECYKGKLHLFEFGDTLPGNVMTIDAIGHTPGHTVYRTGQLLIIGDLMHGAALQFPHPEYCAEYDMDKEKAIASRKRILQYAKENHLLMAGMHLPAPAFLSCQ